MKTKDKYLTVSDVAKLIDVSPDTIRRWGKKGLIKSIRSKHNYRLFNIDEVKRLNNKINGVGGSLNDFKILTTKDRTNYNCIELFAGAGGTALGFHNAGIKHKCLVELDKNCVATLNYNKPEWEVIGGDVKDVDFSNMEADIVEGGFPCQSFSYAGKNLGFADTRGTLFFEFARCVKQIRPKIAVGENVKGLLRHDNGRTLQAMIDSLRKIGYRVVYKVLRSQYLDVPQKRERLIILAVRNDLSLPFLFPKEKDYTVSLREALKDVPKSRGQEYPSKKKHVLSLVPPGGCWRDLPEKIQKEYMMKSYYLGGGKTGMARRLSWDEPSLTLTTSTAQNNTER